MAAGKYDLYIEQGSTFIRSCVYKDQNGDPVDLTGYALNAQIRRSYSDTTIAQTISIAIEDQTIPANVGKFIMSISAANTSLIAVNPAVDFENNITNYTWDLELSAGGNVSRLLQGTVLISPEVTK
jgi:hypothetical protein